MGKAVFFKKRNIRTKYNETTYSAILLDGSIADCNGAREFTLNC
jgi:hypothetical protein